MARGRQLIQLVTDLRNEIGRANSVAVGVEDLYALKQKISRTQEVLYGEYDWPFLSQIFDQKPLQAGERYYDFPDELDFERIKDQDGVVVWWNSRPQTVDRGISFREYATYDSQRGVRVNPVLRWEVRWTGTAPQFEVWPMPASNDMTIQFEGIRKLRPLVNDSDVADLDDQLIVLTCAAELAKDKQTKADLKAMALTRFARVKGRATTGSKRYRMGMAPAEAAKPLVVVRAN